MVLTNGIFIVLAVVTEFKWLRRNTENREIFSYIFFILEIDASCFQRFLKYFLLSSSCLIGIY